MIPNWKTAKKPTLKFSPKTITTVILLLGILFGFKEAIKPFRNSDSILGRISNLINRNNHIKVQSNYFDLKEVEIIWISEFDESRTVYKNGKEKEKIGHIYGHNRFIVKHREEEIIKSGHFKTNNWHSHDYIFIINTISDNLYSINFIVDGPNEHKSIDTIPINMENKGIKIKDLPIDSFPEYSTQYSNEIFEISNHLNIDEDDNLEIYNTLFKRRNEIKFPHKNIPTKREFLSRLGFAVGQTLVSNSNWSWKYLQIYNDEYIGWFVVSPNNELGLAVEQYFFQSDFYKKEINFDNFIKLTKEEFREKAVQMNLYEPWK